MLHRWKYTGILYRLLNCNVKTARSYSNKSSLDVYDISRLKPSHFEPAWNIMKEVFFKEDEYCKIIGLCQAPEAREELRFFFDFIAEDDAGYIAVNKEKQKVEAICIGKLWIPAEIEYLKQKVNTLKYDSSKDFVQQFIDFNIFDYLKVDCAFEGMIAATLPEARGKKLSSKLIPALHDLAKEMAKKRSNEVRIPKVYFAFNTAITDHVVKKFADCAVDIEKDVMIKGEKKKMKWILRYEYL